MKATARYHVSYSLLDRGEMQSALRERDFQQAFSLMQHYDEISQEKIASQIDGMTQGRVSRIINGKDHISSMDLIERVADGLQIPGRLLGLRDRHWEENQLESGPGVVGDTPRDNGAPQVFSQPSIDAATRLLTSPDQLESAIRRLNAAQLTEISIDKLEWVEATLTDIARDYDFLTPERVTYQTLRVQAQAELLISRQAPPAIRTRVLAAAAWCAAILANSAFDLGAYGATWSFCKEAFQLASLAGKRELMAWIRLTQSTTAYYQGDYKTSIDLAAHGRRVAGNTPIAARIASSSEARSLAATGNMRGLNTAIDAAFKALDSQSNDIHGSPGRYIFTLHPADLQCHVANALTVAGDTVRSNRLIGEAKPSLDEYGATGLMAMIRIDEATNLIRRGASSDVDQAAYLIKEALFASSNRTANWIDRKIDRFFRDAGRLPGTDNRLSDARELATQLKRARPPQEPDQRRLN